jgi:hypothetical protein
MTIHNIDLPAHILNSLGYNNLIQELQKVFEGQVEIVSCHQDMDEDKDRYDDFKLLMRYRNHLVLLWIGETRTEGMMHKGAGGWFSIRIPKESSFSLESWFQSKNLISLVSPEEADYLKYEGSVGGNPQAVEKSLLILKKYLDRNSGNIYGFK